MSDQKCEACGHLTGHYDSCLEVASAGYEVRLDVCVKANNGFSTEWFKELRLPFPPWEGLKIRDVDGRRDPHFVEDIEWQLEHNSFWVGLGSEEWFESVDVVASEMRANGWQLS